MSTFRLAPTIADNYELQNTTSHAFQTIAVGRGFLAVVKVYGRAFVYQNTKNNGFPAYFIKSNVGPLAGYADRFRTEEFMTALFMSFIETIRLIVMTEPDLLSFEATVKKEFPSAVIQIIHAEALHRGMNITPNCDFHEGDA